MPAITETRRSTGRAAIAFFSLWACLFSSSCTNSPPQATVIGGADGATQIVVADKERDATAEAIRYELPQCRLYYTRALPEALRGAQTGMWTEREAYGGQVRTIDVLVMNPSDVPFDFGRRWNLHVWDGERYVAPEQRGAHPLIWEEDLFVDERAPLLYCFRFPVGEYYRLPKGRYRLTKTFGQNGKQIELKADFTIID